jgi:hypothetical protein
MTEENRTENDAAEEPKAARYEPDLAQSDPVAEAAVVTFGDDARSQFPNQVEAALDYAANNRYEYGPRLRDAELTWEVISCERMANDIVRVRLGYLPIKGFRGDPGSEYMDIDPAGAILARRQMSTPKENSPMVLMGVTGFSVVLAVVLISLMTVFKSDGADPLYVSGRTLWIRAEEPKQQQYITYQGADREGTLYNWAMKPDDEVNNELVYIKVTLINQTSGTVNIVVDEGAATLLDGNRASYEPLNSIDRAYSAEPAPKFSVPEFVPMWGSIKLNSGEQVVGMMVFELPANSTYTELRWSASDSATIRYQ